MIKEGKISFKISVDGNHQKFCDICCLGLREDACCLYQKYLYFNTKKYLYKRCKECITDFGG